MTWTIGAIKEANKEAGKHFFERGTMRFFKSKIMSGVYEGPGGIFFVTEETGPNNRTAYTVRVFNPATGEVGTHGEFNNMGLKDARAVAREAANPPPPVEHSYGWDHLAAMPRGSRLYTVLRHVSSTGMTRWIDVCWIENNELRWARVEESQFYVKNRFANSAKADYKVGGCGMDIGYHLVYSLGHLIHGDGYWFEHSWI